MYYHEIGSPVYQRSFSNSNLNHNNASHTRYPSLENNASHLNLQRQRTPSKKLTITAHQSNYSNNYATNFAKEAYEGLKRQGRSNFEKKAKFISLNSSKIYESRCQDPEVKSKNNISSHQLHQAHQILNSLKNQAQQKIERLSHEYSKLFHEQSIRIKELENQIIRNNQQIYAKNKKIEELTQIMIKIQNKESEANTNKYLIKKITDLQAQLQVIIQEKKSENSFNFNLKIDKLSNSLMNYFGLKFLQIKKSVNLFVNLSEEKVNKIQNSILNSLKIQNSMKTSLKIESSMKISKTQEQITFATMKSHIQSQGSCTIDSICQNEYSEWQKLSDLSYDNQAASFSDDYFFHPPQALEPHHNDAISVSQKVKSIQDLLRDRSVAVRCYIDKLGFLRYKESDAYFFDKKGNILAPSFQEVECLQKMKVLRLC